MCLKEFFADQKLACVYTTNRNVSPDDTLIAKGYNWPLYSREKLTTAMIAHHFRMFTLRAWNLTDGFDEKIANAIDYDMYLKLSEIGPFKHVNKICYNRILHGENTSIKKIGLQKENHFKVVNHSLARQDIANYRYAPADIENDSSRKYQFERLIKSKNLLHQSNASHKINFTHAENIYTEPYLWLSLGENCLPDDILKRHNKKSFSTIYSSGRTNIDYALYLENKNYIDLLDSRNLDYGDAWGKKVVRSTNIIKCDDIFEPGCSKGFEFTHHDPISSAKDRESCERKIQRLQEARGNNNIVFLYFHRSNQKTNIEKLSIKLKELADHYTKNNKNCIIAFFHQVIIQEKNTRNLEINKHPNGILEFIFLTEKIWGGTDPELLWARSDDDLIRLMIQAVSSAKRNRSVNGSNLKVAGPSQAYEKRLPTAC